MSEREVVDTPPSSPPNCAETTDSPLYRQLRDAAVAYITAWDAKEWADEIRFNASLTEVEASRALGRSQKCGREKAVAFDALRKAVSL